jgi:hypothetical protein
MIDTDRSSQQNRNFWSRVKNWSSTTPAEGKHQQFGSLCTRCRENKKRQIEEAAERHKEDYLQPHQRKAPMQQLQRWLSPVTKRLPRRYEAPNSTFCSKVSYNW